MALRVAVDAQDAGAVVGEKFAAEGTVLLPGLLVIAGFEIEPGEIRTRGLDRRTQSPVSQREGRAWFYFCVGLGGIPGGFIYIMVGEVPRCRGTITIISTITNRKEWPSS